MVLLVLPTEMTRGPGRSGNVIDYVRDDAFHLNSDTQPACMLQVQTNLLPIVRQLMERAQGQASFGWRNKWEGSKQ